MLIHKLCKDVLTLSCFTCVQNEVVLSNGSLFILQATAEIAGSYQCNGYYNDESLNSTTYHVSIAQGTMSSTIELCTVHNGISLQELIMQQLIDMFST